jgi:hypothetical protein
VRDDERVKRNNLHCVEGMDDMENIRQQAQMECNVRRFYIMLSGAGVLLALAALSGATYAQGKREEKRELAVNNPGVFIMQ